MFNHMVLNMITNTTNLKMLVSIKITFLLKLHTGKVEMITWRNVKKSAISNKIVKLLSGIKMA